MKIRYEDILAAALSLSEESHYLLVTREDIAERACVTVGLVSYYLGNMSRARGVILAEAVRRGRARIVAQGLLSRDPVALDAPQELRDAARREIQ